MVSEISAEDWIKLKDILDKLPLEQRLISLRKLVLSATKEIQEEIEQMIHEIEEELAQKDLVKVVQDSPTSVTIESLAEEIPEKPQYISTEPKKYYLGKKPAY